MLGCISGQPLLGLGGDPVLTESREGSEEGEEEEEEETDTDDKVWEISREEFGGSSPEL